MPSYYEKHGGGVLSVTLDKHIYIMVNRKFDGNIRVSYAKTENVTSWKEIDHDLVRGALMTLKIEKGIEIISVADIPGRGTGLGSSSTFSVGLLLALREYRNLYSERGREIEDIHHKLSRIWLASAACELEIDICGKTIGKQDQYAAAYGGLNYIEFNQDGTVRVKNIELTEKLRKDLEDNLMLFYTGITRKSSDILTEQDKKNSDVNNIIGLREMHNMAKKLAADFTNGDISNLGEVLHECWMIKKGLASGITSPGIDTNYSMARNLGASGGKLLGAGGGGFLLLCVPREKHKHLEEYMLPLRRVPLGFSARGSRVVYMEGLND